MWLTIKHLGLAVALASITTPPPVLAQAASPAQGTAEPDSPFLTTNPTLQASLERISRGSAQWRIAAEAARKTGRYALVATPADLVISKAGGRGHARDLLQPGILAEAIPVFASDSQTISAVVIVVNLRLVQEAHDARLSVPRDFEADLDRILVHEVYGHAVPYLLAGDSSGRCADPMPDESASEACSIRRENAVREELGLGRRTDHGLSSLRLAMGVR